MNSPPLTFETKFQIYEDCRCLHKSAVFNTHTNVQSSPHSRWQSNVHVRAGSIRPRMRSFIQSHSDNGLENRCKSKVRPKKKYALSGGIKGPSRDFSYSFSGTTVTSALVLILNSLKQLLRYRLTVHGCPFPLAITVSRNAISSSCSVTSPMVLLLLHTYLAVVRVAHTVS